MSPTAGTALAITPFTLSRRTPCELCLELRQEVRRPFTPQVLAEAEKIVEDVRTRGRAAVIEHCLRFGDLREGETLILQRSDLEAAVSKIPLEERELLQRTATRIREFAEAQMWTVSPVEADIPGGRAGQTMRPMQRAGCYAPGGRHPLPSTVLMTVVTARVAGVKEVWLASPHPSLMILAAAGIAGADAVLQAGGAHAIAALAYGAGEVPACECVVGPGNAWVTAAKFLVSQHARIDMLAGPSELVVVADDTADPTWIAADLLAQAEHDVEALPILIATSESLLAAVEQELARQLVSLPTADTARAALEHGFAVLVDNLEDIVSVCDALAPEHLELHGEIVRGLWESFANYGTLFIGSSSGEVIGDYGAGPNHVLPTGGTARSTGGLSVLSFLRTRTWMEIHNLTRAQGLLEDAAALARHEGLEAHARAAEIRLARAKEL